MELIQIVWVVISAAVFAVSGYLKSVGEKPDPVKFLSTLIIGAIIGLIFSFMGAPVTEEAIMTMLVTYIGAVVVVENMIKAVIRRWEAWKAKRGLSN